ncbi:hypothetical protein [Parabacteroides sp. FAFU027]|uniref:hypothetical protein n=1 Tax=Parabacteroides sp. FAFU027 TaxID=2922715 RepID=UPI001FAE8F74|nr:hypothetical protein [Parabacteroides sp. FAFU027]
MSNKSKIKFYPVGNADNVLIKGADDTTIIVDCQIKKSETDSNGVTNFDVKKDLIKELKKDSSNNPFVDLFVLSHPHLDHSLGFDTNYYTGNPQDYNDSNRKNEEIIIGEMWVTQRVFANDICEEAVDIRKEAKRRRTLFETNPTEADKYGNRLRIIGYNDQDKTVEGLHYIPGQLVSKFNGKTSGFISLFIHAPFKASLVASKLDDDHNSASIAFQVRFSSVKNGSIVSRLMMSGDSDHYVWQMIKDKSEEKGNQDKLTWDLFLAPHHCSWMFFNDTPYDKNKDPKDYALEVLDYKTTGAEIISSSVEILDNDANPPCHQAKDEYVAKVGKSHFRNTAVNKDKKAPQPIVYLIDEDGFTFEKMAESAASTVLTHSTPRAGRSIC